jgi:hypothetical protein
MQLNQHKVKNVLKKKGVTNLHHANTVGTACTFLKYGGLLSRGLVEQENEFQTIQGTDELDKELGIWHDIFLDSDDIHARAKRHNKYGPVLFVFSLDLLDSEDLPPVWITKLNPTKWSDAPSESRYFKNLEELEVQFSKGTFDQMITLRNADKVLPFNYLEKILLDDPSYYTKDDSFEIALERMRVAAEEGGLNPDLIQTRKCEECDCYTSETLRKNSPEKEIYRYFKACKPLNELHSR